MMKRLNPICQRIEWDSVTGQRGQCRRPSQVVHHLKDPKDAPALSFEAGNVVCLCVNHHPGGQQGTAWVESVDYVPTNTPKHSIPRG
ncbi:MAG TPA: hypothetical protein VFN26_11605 [Candidatus Acidoferrum sp.]|nr:hypothetical protein [Candidatus Acidoferrum sp.]